MGSTVLIVSHIRLFYWKFPDLRIYDGNFGNFTKFSLPFTSEIIRLFQEISRLFQEINSIPYGKGRGRYFIKSIKNKERAFKTKMRESSFCRFLHSRHATPAEQPALQTDLPVASLLYSV